MRSVVYDTAGYTDVWAIPNTTRLIFVTGCGGGASGGASTGTRGGSGGGAGFCVERLPLVVTPGKGLAIRVATASGSAGTGTTVLAGNALLSPICWRGFINFLSLGYGIAGGANSGTGGGTSSMTVIDGLHGQFMQGTNGVAPYWAWNRSSLPFQYGGTFTTGDGSAVGPSNPYSYGRNDMHTVGGRGVGVAVASDATYGSGGPGAGGLFGTGGTGGSYPGHVDGYAATGFGAGGGGAAFGGFGGAGTGGLLVIEYH